jgi:endonuclease G, mitochondrial
MTPVHERIKRLIEQMGIQDPALIRELYDKSSGAAMQAEAAGIKAVLQGNSENFNESFGDSDFQEAVILRTGRPVLIVYNSEADMALQEPDSEIWSQRLKNARQALAIAVPATGRIGMKNHPGMEWCGTGWLIDNDIVVTNRHVAEIFGKRSNDRFTFRQADDGSLLQCDIDLLQEYNRPDKKAMDLLEVLYIEPEPGPDIAFLRAKPIANNMPAPIALTTQPVTAGTDVAVIGYPAYDSRMPDAALMRTIFKDVFDKKRLAPGKITQVSDTRIQHDCSTLGGCSGSAIIDLQSGKAVGLHFSGKFLQANNAVSAAVVAERLNAFKRNTLTARHEIFTPALPAATATPDTSTTPANRSFSITAPLQITVSLDDSSAIQLKARLADGIASLTASAQGPEEFNSEARAEDYADRTGYLENFLGDEFTVPLPEVTGKREKDITTYLLNGKEEAILRYTHFSVKMCKSRRQCFFSAVNINGTKPKKADRVAWRRDPRIPDDAQILYECYGDPPKYSRGHMTRREDPIWGTETAALQGNADSMCVTNTVPQMQSFNSPVWLGLEDYALNHAREDKMLISVFTGPVFKSNDRVQYGVKIPVDFWKIIVFIHDETGKLSATGYMMSQREHLPDEEFVFGAFGTAQVSIASIEKKTGLSFGRLSDADPLDSEAAGDPVRPILKFKDIRF